MQVEETNAEGLKREFKITVGAADIEARLEGQLADLRQRIRLPGFRPGKAPLSLLRKLHGQSLMGQVLEETIQTASQKALEERDLRPALQPKVDIKTFEEGKDLEYTLEVEVLPAIEIPDFSKLKLERLVAPVSDEQVEEHLERIASSQKNYEPAAKTYKAKEGDAVVIDFVGKRDGEPFEGGAAEDYQLELGSGAFIPGFEEQLVGVKAGDEKEVKVTFPEHYGAKDLAGKDVVFEVKVKEVRKPAPVKLDDDFAKSLGLEDLEALKKAIHDQVDREQKALSRARLKRSLLDALAETQKFDVPPGMVEMEFEQIWNQVMADLRHQAMHEGEDDDGHHHHHDGEEMPEIEEPGEDVKAEYRAIADRRVRLGLLLSEVGQKNNITVGQDEITRLIAQEARRFPGQEDKVFEFYTKNPQAMAQLRAPLYEDKVVDFILELADIKDKEVSREELQKAVEEDDDLPQVKPVVKKKAAKKAAAKKGAGSKSAAKKPAAKKEAEAESGSKKKAPAEKATATKATAKKTTAKKAPAKKAEPKK
ncbi:MAG: trigger factor [Alphaproteobacteria bacterium]|nr:MAG: trigger factor [Alphaproteobacteria bacterium]